MARNNSATRTLLTHHLTWAAIAIVAILEAAFFYWFRPSFVMTAAAGGLGLACLALWVPVFRRSSSFAAGLYDWIKEQEAEQLAKLETLAADFIELEFPKGAAQVKLLQGKLGSITEILKRRLDAREVTYGRYLGMAQEVYGSAIDNLHEVAIVLRSVSTIDMEYIAGRLNELDSESRKSADHDREIKALRERNVLLEDQTKRVAALMAQNESAMTVIDQAAAALAATRTTRGLATMDADTAMGELEQLAKRAGKYAASR